MKLNYQACDLVGSEKDQLELNMQAAEQLQEPASIAYTPEWQELLEHRKEIEKTYVLQLLLAG